MNSQILIGPIQYKHRYGYINPSGDFVIEPVFEYLGEFREGLACFKRDGRYGFIEATGSIVIEPIFGSNRIRGPSFSSGLASVDIDNRCGYIDTQGKVVIPPTFLLGWDFMGDYAFVDTDQPKKGYFLIDKAANLLTRFDVYEVPYISDWPENWDLFGCFVLKNDDFMAAMYNSQGECVFPPKYPYLTNFCNGIAGYCECDSGYNHPWGLVSLAGNIVKSPEYYSMGCFEAGRASAGRTPKLFGYINSEGEWVIEPQFRQALTFSDGLACVTLPHTKRRGNKGFINLQGDLVIEPRFDRQGSFQNGFAQMEYEGKQAVIDKTGRILWEAKLED